MNKLLFDKPKNDTGGDGHSSPTSFNRGFQKVHGITPTAAKAMGSILQAVSQLCNLPIVSNCNILLADKSGNMVVVECTPAIKKIREPEIFHGERIVCTVNSFVSDEMKPYDDANGNDYDSHKRYKVVIDSFSSGQIGNHYIETTKQLLKGNYGFMCQYDNEPDFETVWSSIFDLENLAIYRAEGDPRKKRFVNDNRLHDLKFK